MESSAKQAIKDYLNNSPLVKTIGFIVSVVLTSFLCSALVADITNGQGELVLSKIWHSGFTIALFIVIAIEAVYYWFVYQADIDIMHYMDDKYCAAYIRKENLKAIADEYKKAISEGKQIPPISTYLNSLNPEKK